jgi:hypothetical protein
MENDRSGTNRSGCQDCAVNTQSRVQPAEVGIRLTPRDKDVDASASAVEHKAEKVFLKQLRGRSAALHIQDYEPWMSARSHRNLLS